MAKRQTKRNKLKQALDTLMSTRLTLGLLKDTNHPSLTKCVEGEIRVASCRNEILIIPENKGHSLASEFIPKSTREDYTGPVITKISYNGKQETVIRLSDTLTMYRIFHQHISKIEHINPPESKALKAGEKFKLDKYFIET